MSVSRASWCLLLLAASTIAISACGSTETDVAGHEASLLTGSGTVATDLVGTIPYHSEVDAHGRLNVVVPLKRAVGRGGVAPDLALRYVSGAGESLVGRGWSLDGLSRIHSCLGPHPADRVGEHAFARRLCLDGVPLVDRADGYWVTVPDRHVRAYKRSESQWVVQDLHGMTSIYGGDDATLKDESGAAQAWHLSEVRDGWGNAFRVHYELASAAEGGAVHRPSEITYTHHADRQATRRIELRYEHALPDARDHFERGIHQHRPALLSEIRMYGPDLGVDDPRTQEPVLMWRYELRHGLAAWGEAPSEADTLSGMASELAALRQCLGEVGECLPPLTFRYQARETPCTVGGNPSPNCDPVFDESADGVEPIVVPDLVRRVEFPPGQERWTVPVWGQFDTEPGLDALFPRDLGGYLTMVGANRGDPTTVPSGFRFLPRYSAPLRDFPGYDPVVLDVDGDGVDDLLRTFPPEEENPPFDRYGMSYLHGDGDGTFTRQPLELDFTPTNLRAVQVYGDPRPEVVYCEGSTDDPGREVWWVTRYEGGPRFEPGIETAIRCSTPDDHRQLVWTPGGDRIGYFSSDGARHHPFIVDIDQDGTTEWIVTTGDAVAPRGIYVWSESRLYRVAPLPFESDEQDFLRLADFNGDGLLDLIRGVESYTRRWESRTGVVTRSRERDFLELTVHVARGDRHAPAAGGGSRTRRADDALGVIARPQRGRPK
ncbi:MAG TPA: SpvB/TcaC N-terminal domain-containing protein [Polyangiaceae bacterium LLY-WYZ-15_(1-7)]|nr:hypothetical protein [Myxococcales bacterium]MAT26363.1 hypothetical protein [Sandaracinus sp.]HJK93740.1 SpvB/TcaC N-terminal domain-containing protein [Polyangiaceae bacterium LLY-WYZ-15_(1-7)]MBJ70125.1 hypothetical protein [Sandaracinus sp.]HJL04924.1 SpvB/TcaC N-terminal domain-containing protein [Polyangiaceae bacterium LLY-WYZ-15_(1-7)]